MFLSERVIVRPLIVVSTSLLQVFTGEAGRAVGHRPRHPAAAILAGGAFAVPHRQPVDRRRPTPSPGWVFPRLFGAAWDPPPCPICTR